jgi:hypothetical protein
MAEAPWLLAPAGAIVVTLVGVHLVVGAHSRPAMASSTETQWSVLK